MRAPVYDDPREPWADDYYTPRPATPAVPDAYVDEDRDDRIPFGFQIPRRSSPRPMSRQQRANARNRR